MPYAFEPDFAIHPGMSIKEFIEASGMTQQEFASRLGMSIQNLTKILTERSPVTQETALALEKVTGTKASFWNNLQSRYDEAVIRRKEEEEADRQKIWTAKFPVRELAARGVLDLHGGLRDAYEALLEFFAVASPAAWNDIWLRPEAAPRRSQSFRSNPYIASSWIRMGEKLAMEGIPPVATNKADFRRVLPKILALTTKSPEEFIPLLREHCASAGVILVLVPEIRGLTWSGATKWLTQKNAMILLNLRGKSEDKFWFSFFHEACHVIHDSKKDLLINDGSIDDEREIRANAFAEKILCCGMQDRIMRARSAAQLVEISRETGVSVGIIAGQHRHLTGNYRCHAKLIKRFEWAPQA